MGDELRLMGLVSEAADRAGRTVLAVDERLVPLAARSFPAIEVRARGTVDESQATRQIPMGSLPAILRADLDAFPDHAGYLHPDPQAIADFRARLKALGPGLAVGIAWTSGLVTARRQGAHGPLEEWEAVLRTEGIKPVLLQYGPVEDEVRAAEAAFGCTIARWDDLDLKDDLDRVAALTAALDLMIATGSAVGTPLWSLLRPRDWVTLGTDRHPWYPAARTFHRAPGAGWRPLLEGEVAPALAALAKDQRS